MGTMLLRLTTKLRPISTPILSSPIRLLFSFPSHLQPFTSPLSQVVARWKSSGTRARAPDTPVKSKLNKYKIKGYSSYKRRFKPLNDGTIRRWKEGNAHNAHSKTPKQRRRLRKPTLVHLAYAKTMKKLNFFG